MSKDDPQSGMVVGGERQSDSLEGVDHEKARRGTRLLLESMGYDPTREDLIETWQRRVPSILSSLTEGSRDKEKPSMKTFEAETDELVVKTGIPAFSLCKHHLLPYHGTVHLAYRPNGSVVGLSKLTRYVRWQSRQLTMQEQLTEDLANGIAEELGAEVVIVEMSMNHLCEAMRGVETETSTLTHATVGTPSERERDRFQKAIELSS